MTPVRIPNGGAWAEFLRKHGDLRLCGSGARWSDEPDEFPSPEQYPCACVYRTYSSDYSAFIEYTFVYERDVTGTVTERWALTAAELKNPQSCERDDEFVVYPAGELVGVLVTRDGKATNRWGDGSIGVPDEVRQDAEAEEELYDTESAEPLDEWRDVVCDRDGHFIRFAKEES